MERKESRLIRWAGIKGKLYVFSAMTNKQRVSEMGGQQFGQQSVISNVRAISIITRKKLKKIKRKIKH